MILADENIDAVIVAKLRSSDIDVVHIKEDYVGVSDEEVINISKNPSRIILTEDKDFGEWVYAHDAKNISVIFLRYRPVDTQKILNILIDLLLLKGVELFGKFTTITIDKVRIRSLK